MKLDRELAREIKAANGDGGRNARFLFLAHIDAVVKECSTPDVMRNFDQCFQHHPRAAIAVCVAATIVRRYDRLSLQSICWANSVLECWTNRPPSGISRAIIDDGLHPSRIEEYAGSFIRLTTT